MKRFLAIRVERPRRGFATIVRLRGAATGRRGFMPLTPMQTTADIRFYQIDQNGRRRRSRSLRAVRIEDLSPDRQRGDALMIEVRYDGTSTVAVEISEHGRLRERLSIPVEREPRRPRWLLLLLLFCGLGTGLWFGLPDRNPALVAGSPAETDIAQESMATETPVTVETPVPAADRDPSPEPTPTDGADNSGTTESLSGESPPATDNIAEEAVGADSTAPEDRSVPSGQALLFGDGASVVMYFQPDSTVLSATALRQVDAVVGELQSRPAEQVLIVGHAAPYGSEAGRSGISRGRAVAVLNALRAAGWAPTTEPLLEWRGATQPVTRAIREQYLNRRVEIRILAE